MTKKTKKAFLKFLKGFLPYLAATISIIGLVSVGSLDKEHQDVNLNLSLFTTDNYIISTDQLSELYIVASLSSALNLASTDDVASNYVITTALYKTGQASAEKLSKPSIIETTSPCEDTFEGKRNICQYVVRSGDTLASIAEHYHLTTDQIRWSNKLKKEGDIKEGDTLYLPSVSGIVYTVKKNDTIDSIASTYGSNAYEITHLNDLELSGISEGMRILIKDGSLPEKERPEYVPPRPVVVVASPTYTYYGNTAERKDIVFIDYNWYGGGQCVGYALWYRNVSGQSPLGPVPTNWGNANTWASRAAAAGWRVDKTPEVGAVFQTTSGWYGHVGIVVGLFEDGSIRVRETNYNYKVGRVTEATIPAAAVGRFNYIH